MPFALRSAAHRSPTSRSRAGVVWIVKSRGSSCPSSSSLPGERRRDARELAGARAVGARERLAEAVLQAVDVDRAGVPPLERALDRRRLRMSARDDGRDQAAEELRRLERRTGAHRHVDVEAARARRLQVPVDAEQPELVAHPARHVADARERRALHRIQIDRGEVGGVRRRRAREPGILRDDRELHHVEQGRQPAADEAGRHVVVGDGRAAHAGRDVVGRAVLEEGVPVDAVGQTPHHQRAIAARPAGETARRPGSGGTDRPW